MQNALTVLLDIRQRFIKTTLATPNKVNKNKGKCSLDSCIGKRYGDIYQLLAKFFTEITTKGLPFASNNTYEKWAYDEI